MSLALESEGVGSLCRPAAFPAQWSKLSCAHFYLDLYQIRFAGKRLCAWMLLVIFAIAIADSSRELHVVLLIVAFSSSLFVCTL